MPEHPDARSLPPAVPLFPLPNVVLLPHAVLPLHVFEERYKTMTADVLASHRQVAMALLRPGWEKNYYGRAAIEPVVCVGTIISHERLPDGRYNFLLRGHTRAKVVREAQSPGLYRLAELEPLSETVALEPDLEQARHQLSALFERDAYATLPGGRQVRQMLQAGVPTGAVADLAAFHLLGDDQLYLKQSLLAETDVRRRVRRTVHALAGLRPAWQNVPDNASLN